MSEDSGQVAARKGDFQELGEEDLMCNEDSFTFHQRVGLLNYLSTWREQLGGEKRIALCSYMVRGQKVHPQEKEDVYGPDRWIRDPLVGLSTRLNLKKTREKNELQY